MKKFRILFLAGLFCFGMMPVSNMLAAQKIPNEKDKVKEEKTKEKKVKDKKEEMDTMFNQLELSDTDLVLELPDGGIIGGSGAEIRSNDGKLIKSYDVKTDPNSITVSEYKKEEINKIINEDESSPISTFGASIPLQWGDVMILKVNGFYKSQAFSASGWRYSGYQFSPISGSGGYLRWSTYLDDGRVAVQPPSGWAVDFVFNPNYHATAIYRGSYYYFGSDTISNAFGPSRSFYCTYNPVNGSYYLVENK